MDGSNQQVRLPDVWVRLANLRMMPWLLAIILAGSLTSGVLSAKSGHSWEALVQGLVVGTQLALFEQRRQLRKLLRETR